MLKSVSMAALALMFGLPLASGAANLREMAGCKPDVDTSVVSREGLFTAHVVCDRLLIEIPDSLYDRDMLLSTEFAAISGGSDFIAPGTLVSNRAIRLNQRGNKVNIESCEVRHRLGARGGHRARCRGDHSPDIAGDVRHSGARRKRRSHNRPDSDVRHRATPGFALGFMKYFGTKEIDAKSSYIESVKTFSRNIGIRFYQTWVADNADLMKRVQEGEESVVALHGVRLLHQYLFAP